MRLKALTATEGDGKSCARLEARKADFRSRRALYHEPKRVPTQLRAARSGIKRDGFLKDEREHQVIDCTQGNPTDTHDLRRRVHLIKNVCNHRKSRQREK